MILMNYCLLPPTSTPSQEQEKRFKFFLLFGLHGLLDVILISVIKFWDLLLFPILLPRVLPFCVCQINTSLIYLFQFSSALISQRYDCTRSYKPGKGRHKCDHCGELGHKTDRCYALHGFSPKFVAVAQTVPVQPSTMNLTSYDISGQPAIFNEFFKWYKDRHNSGSTAFVAHSTTPFPGLTH